MNTTIQLARVFRDLSDSDLLNLLYSMAERHPETFTELVLKDQRIYVDVPGEDYKVSFSRAEYDELKGFTRDRKVACIKRIREITNLGLKEAKDVSESHFGMNTIYNY